MNSHFKTSFYTRPLLLLMKHKIPLWRRLTGARDADQNKIIPRIICNAMHDLEKPRRWVLAALAWLALMPALSWAQCNTTATTTLSFTDANPARPAGENWNGHLQTGVPEPLGVTRVSSSVLTGGNATSSLVVGTLNNAKSLVWTSDFSAANGVVNVTFNFNRPLSNFTVNLSDIDASRGALLGVDLDPNYTDQVVVTGANAGTATLATDITLAVVAGTASNVAIAGNTATGVDDNNANTNATVRATFATPITSLTLSYRNGPGITDPDAQNIGIDQMTWCRLAPLATNVTTTTVPSTAVQTGISPLASAVDGAVQNYFITSLPTRGTLFYNSAGTTYTAITTIPTGGFSLTPAQANSLRYTPDATYTGSVAATFGYRVRDDAALLSANTATYTIPLQPIASCGTNPGTTTLAFGGRPVGEDWMTHAAEAVPAGSTATLISSGNYQTGAATASLLEINTVNSPTLTWNNDYAPGSTKTSQVTFSFTRPVSNFTVQVQDIDAGGDFIDQVTFQGNNGTTPVTPLLTAANPGAGITTISGNVATGQNITGSPVDGTVTAYFSAPITSLTIIYNNASAATDGANQLIGIDQMTWCRALPTAVDVTSAALLNSIGTAGISPLASLADNVPVTYTLTSVPTAAQGVLSYNSGGTTYTNITAAGQVLTAAQAASLRFTPTAGFSGNATFTYRVTDALNNLSTSTATYTIPVVNAPCLTATAELNFRTSTPVPDDWKAHAAVPVGNALTTVGTSNYQIAAGATTSTFSVLSGTATNNINAVQTLAWVTDYANQTNNTASVTFNFSRPVSNYSMRVQDIDRNEVSGGAAFIDQVTFAGSNGGTQVLPALTAAGATNTVLINGNVATGTTNVANVTDGTVVAYFASPITSITLTYRNTSTFSADPTINGIGIELLNFCRLAPVAADVTNTSRPAGQGAAPINPLSATAPDGTITSYTIAALPPASQGTFFVNGVALTASTLTLTPAQATQLSFAPAAGFSGNAGFSYTATDNAGAVSNVATYSVPVTNPGAPGTPAPCGTPGKDGSPTITANPDTYYPSTTTQALAVGATTINVGTAVIGGTTTTPTTIVKGDLLLVIQMQGADIDFSNSNSYGDGVAGGGASGNLSTNFTAGTYEYVVASNATAIAAATGGAITLATPLVNSYVNAPATATAGPRRFQVIRVPQYGNLTLGGTLAATPWNGTTGGVLVLDVAGQTNFSGNTITAAGRGFRGGGGRTQGTTNYDATDYVNLTATDLNAQKGEGTAGTPRFVNVPTTVNDATTNATVSGGTDFYPASSTSRGAPGNAGGGANDNVNNSGGGGGANGGFGGRGGDSFSGVKPIGGEPGASFALASSSRLVLGGGGGAGTTNNSTGTPGAGAASSGAAGGGIVLLRTGTIIGNGLISANGGAANSSAADDGSGGGGAGGSILVTANSPAGLAGLTLTANGGAGGSNSGGTAGTHGPGGGGGGVILTNGSVASALAAGAANGTTQGNIAYGAAAGLNGVVNTQISLSIAGSTVGTTCAADVTTALAGPATLAPAMPSGTYKVTFTNEGPATATNVTRTVTLPAGATNIIVNGAPYSPTTANTIDFGTAASVASGASSTFTFSFTPATTATGSASIISNVATASGQGSDTAPNSSTINASIAPVANVATTISAGAPVAAGTPASVATAPKFTVNFTNNGPSPAAGVVASVQLPRGLTNVTASNGGVYSPTTGLVTYAGLTSLGNAATTTSLINFDAPFSTPVAATASISTTTSEAGQTADDQASTSYGITPAFDLATTISGPAAAVATDLVTLNLTMTNNGPSAVPNAVQTAQLATGLSSVFVSNGGFYNSGAAATSVTYGGVAYTVPAGGVIYPPLANLPSGQTVTNSVSFAMPGTAFKPTASVSTTTTGETALANNSANLNNAATNTAPAATLNVASPTGNPANVYTTLSATTAPNTNNVTVSVVTGNRGGLGSTSASGIVETVQLLPGLSNVAITDSTGAPLPGASYNATTGVVTFASISLNSGAKLRNLITFTAPAGVGNNGQLLLTAAVATANLDPVPADNVAATTVAIRPTTDLAVSLTGPSTATVGQPVQYTATLLNNGPMTASGYNANGTLTSGIFTTVQLPVGLSGVTVTNAAGTTVTGASYDATTGLVTLPAPTTLATGATRTYNLSFIAPAQTLAIRASVSSATTDVTLTNNSATVITTVTPTADLVTSVAGPATAPVGNPVTYTLNTANNGASVATTVVPTLQLPAGFAAATLQVNGGTGTPGTGTTVNYPDGATYDTATGLVTFPATASLAAGANVANRVTFLMPSPASGQVSGVGTATSATADLTPGNNGSSVATSIAPATTTTADLVATVSGSPAPVAAGSPVTFTAIFGNNGAGTATNVLPTLQLPAGLTGLTVSDNGTYSPATGLVTWPAILSQAPNSQVSYTATFPAPANGPLVALVGVSSDTSEPNTTAALTNNANTGTVIVNAFFDVVTRISGPAAALAGTSQTYTVTTLDNGPSAVPNTVGSPTIQKVTVPAGQVPTNITGGGVYSSTDNTITWTITAAQATGPAGAVTNSYTIVQPAGGYAPVATVSTPGDSNFDPTGNTATVTTALPNQQPTAVAVVNALRSPTGNTAANSTTAPFGQLISPLAALDPENALSATAPYTITTIPTTAQGTLYYLNGGTYTAITGVQNLTAAQAGTLRFLPALGYVGNAAFTYLATDNAGNQSPAVTYTLPVGTDLSATYATYNTAKGGASPYVTGDVLAQATDPNATTYTSTGALYNTTTGAQLANTNNGLSNAVLTSGTLPSGVSLDPATGRIYVSNAAALVNNNTAQNYTVSVTTTDAFGGVTTVPVTFSLGASPLPVVLSAFTATAVANRDAQLAWTTASELNSAAFEVERSFDGTTFTKLGQLAAKGTTLSPSAYAFLDKGVASLANGPVYYRLKQVDRDAKFAYSPVRTVAFTKAAGASLSLFPNPAQTTTKLDLTSLPAASTYQVTLLDATGRAVRSLTLAGGQVQPLELSTLASGTYFVLVTGTQADGAPLRQSLRLTKE
jgi:uncharacterized repeat protein (TIGR01451 family)